ncbi:hypothetical protein GmHk_15G043468 [Glycine max]|nr:hypothetical protein GmHk_15G043468 [Glycine max]
MFQICNGILEFVAKTSLMISSYSDSFDHLQNLFETKPTIVSNMDVVHLGSFESPENVPLGVEEQVKLQEEYNEEVSEEGEYQEEAILCSTKTEGKESEAHITEEEEIEEEDEEGETKTITTNEDLVNTNDLTKKFEEFIRKMKEEIRIEAQRQLIVV